MTGKGMLKQDRNNLVWIYADDGDGNIGWLPFIGEYGRQAEATELFIVIERFSSEEDPSGEVPPELNERLDRIERDIREIKQLLERYFGDDGK